MRSITEEFECSPECPVCRGEGMVCENYPECQCIPGCVFTEHHPTHTDRYVRFDCCSRGGCGAFMPCPSIAKQREVLGAAGG